MIKNLLQEMFLLKEKGYYKQAIEILYKLLEIVETQDETNEIIYELAEVYFLANNHERATHYLEKLLEVSPNHALALRLQIKLSGDEPTKRIFIAKKLYKLTSKPEDLRLYLALLNKAGEYEEVAGYKKTSIETNCYYEIAEALYYLKQFNSAKEILEKQNQLSEIGELLLAKICYALNDEESLALLENKFSKSKNQNVLNFVIKLEYELMNYSKVIELSRKIKPITSPEMLYIIGQAYLFKKRFSQAKKMFNRLCEIDNSPRSQFALALAYIGAKQTSLAIETVENNSEYLKLITFILNEKAISRKSLSKEFLAVKELLKNDVLALFTVIDICINRRDSKTLGELLSLIEITKNLRFNFYRIKQLILSESYETAEKILLNYRNIEPFAMLYAELLDAQNRFEELEQLLENHTTYEEYEYEQCCYYYAHILEAKCEPERAIDIALKGLEYISQFAEKYYTLLYRLYKQIGEARIALDCLEKAATYNPDLHPQVVKEAALL